ncbi:DUF1993 domain-containing protein [Pontixanthobacter aestiaquae]|uniref:DUF1993 family protein n=1 Tax=Pontixanthobacter aestiaquae TaxID=1509367 RepID=A0A844Z494_9SPHN|nr:DUF1993 domain-containing protein [Pontixanthobacter aestiaquae]MDN3646922.1 DUF1993 domain-containing protein [Pontixanthobacter aestiaquae]MXO82096.1 DUF1993 family protein [Pontixanthobacter aestiaquae]
MTLYEQSIPVYRQGLTMLSGLLNKAEAHAKGDTLLQAKLADDMHPLAVQIRFLSNQPGEAAERLTGRAFTSRDENDASFADAKAALAKMDEYLGSIQKGDMKDGDSQTVLDLPNGMQFTMTLSEYIRDWAMPNFYFHLTTAYAILRAEGLEIGKADFVPHMFKYATKMPES